MEWSEISGSQGDDYEDGSLLEYRAVNVDRRCRGAYCLHLQGAIY